MQTSRRADEPTSQRADEPTSRQADEPTSPLYLLFGRVSRSPRLLCCMESGEEGARQIFLVTTPRGMKKGEFSPIVVLRRWPPEPVSLGTHVGESEGSAKERLDTVWNTLQRHLTDEVCEEALEVLQAVTANAIKEEKRRAARRLSNIAAMERLKELSVDGEGTSDGVGTMCFVAHSPTLQRSRREVLRQHQNVSKIRPPHQIKD